MHRALLVPTLSLTLAALTVSRPASACTCASLPSVADERAKSKAVFDAEVLGARLDGNNYVADVRVTRVWHGSPPERLTVGMTDCPPSLVSFTPDGKPTGSGSWLVYAYQVGDRWYPKMCGRTRPYPDASADASELAGPSAAPQASARPEPPSARTGCACSATGDEQESGGIWAVLLGAAAWVAGARTARRRGARQSLQQRKPVE